MKLPWNIPYKGPSVILDSDTRENVQNPSFRSLVQSLMGEVVMGVRACGYDMKENETKKVMTNTEKMTPYEPSMKPYFDRQRIMELEYMHRNPLAATEDRGCSLPQISMMLRQLEYLDARHS